jgi:transcriptional regulator GlxA family with amidase domain
VVPQGKLVTSAGVSSGIDMALQLVADLVSPQHAQAIQLALEYDPAPPFDTGSPEKAPAEIREMVRAAITART